VTSVIDTSSTRPTQGRLLLDEQPARLGPKSKRLLARLVVALSVVELIGSLLVFATESDTWRAFGTSLVFPGVGFLYNASPVLFAVTALLLVLALVLWWGASVHLAIPVVWIASAVVPAVLADGPRMWVDRGTNWDWSIVVAYALAAGFVAVGVWRVERRYRSKKVLIPEINEYLRTVSLPEPIRTPRTPNAMDAELLRWGYSFAFQPDDDLIGLDWGEQFHSGTQVRYQLNGLLWSMSLYAANFVPNAPGVITDALERIALKHTDLRVWKYWRPLNLFGNFDPNPDPIRRDNIMFSAFFCDALNTMEAATGSTRFDEPGSLTFVWKDGRTFPYDHHSIAAAVRRNYDQSRLGFFPCEPGWSFTVCNIMGAQSIRNHDALHGTKDWEEVRDRWARTLDEEYSTPDGSYAHIRSNLVGLSWDTGEVPGGHYHAHGTHRFADILPDHAWRAKALDLRTALPKMQGLAAMAKANGGRLDLEMPAELERHRTSSSSLLGWLKVIGGAHMAGLPELVEAAIEASERQCATGLRWPERPVQVGGGGFGAYMQLRWSQPLDLASLNVRGYVAPKGPLVVGYDSASVLITLARSLDSASLELALEPMDGPVERTVLALAQLQPGAVYSLRSADGADIASATADASGSASITLPALSGAARFVLGVQ